jgi:Mlc titration factor MtfA (ptsG expression regulator)
MVGEGVLNHQMILSQRALRSGFAKQEGHNTAIHEFIHLLDKADGSVDGLPEYMLAKPYIIPWMQTVRREIALIRAGKSDINPYGATNEAEFFAVVGEYFFERPEQLHRKHPQLYDLLQRIFGGEQQSGEPEAETADDNAAATETATASA